jgi:cardiolipin synthase
MMARQRRRPSPRHRPGRRLKRRLRAPRVGAVAQALPGGVRDPGFKPLLSRIDASPFHGGNRVEVFVRGDEAFAAMLSAVSGARSEVLLESYIFKDDATGQAFRRELTRASSRGVAVRVLADGFGSMQTRAEFWDDLRRNGVEVRLYHPLGFPLRQLKFRDHRKILVVDRGVAFTGGMNIGDEYGSSRLPRGDVFRDTHARVEGPAAWEMAVVFEEGWERAGGAPIGLDPLTPSAARGARVLVLDSRPGRGSEEAAAVLAAIVGAARKTLWLTTAYFAPRTRALAILGSAAERGVDVRLLLPGRTDVRIVGHAGHGFFSGLLSRGVRIFEYQPAILHAKTLVADGLVSVIGSSNLDFRSFELNAECNFVIEHVPTAERMEAAFQEDLNRSEEIRLAAWRRRNPLHRLGDWLARRLAPLL